MYLLNHSSIKSLVAVGDTQGLYINPMDAECLQHTFYYFRLGAKTERQQGANGEWIAQEPLTAKQPLILAPGDCVRIESREYFSLGSKYLGLFGAHSGLARRGLSLLHGPFIDPLFPTRGLEAGKDEETKFTESLPLEIVIVNHGAAEARIEFEERIGKVTFFDISDTYPVSMESGSLADKNYARRATPSDLHG